jgi:hypothetical protein
MYECVGLIQTDMTVSHSLSGTFLDILNIIQGMPLSSVAIVFNVQTILERYLPCNCIPIC